jgi:hypothetical protein
MVLTCDPHLIAAVFDRQLDGVLIDKTPGVRSFDIVRRPHRPPLPHSPSLPLYAALFSFEDLHLFFSFSSPPPSWADTIA